MDSTASLAMSEGRERIRPLRAVARTWFAYANVVGFFQVFEALFDAAHDVSLRVY